MVAMVAIDDRTRFASSHRQPEAREWISTCLRVHRRGIRVPQPTSDFFSRGLAWGGGHGGHGGHRRSDACKSATRRRGLTHGCGSASGRTRVVSACTTRATRLARSRKCALSLGAHQFKLDLTACDRRGTRRVGRARRGGAGLSCLAVACWAVFTLNGTHELHKLHKCLGMRRSPWQCHEPAGPTGDRHDAHVASMEPVPRRNGAAASPTGARTTRRHHKARPAERGRVLLVSF